MEGTEMELELRERLLIQGETFSVNRDKKLTEQMNRKIIEELQGKSSLAAIGHDSSGYAYQKAKKKRRRKISDYSYYLQVMEENKFPLEMLPENTRFKRIKEIGVRMMRLVFQWQQYFNKATEDVMIMLTKDMKSMDIRQQGLEEKLDSRVNGLLEKQNREIQQLRATVEELTRKQQELLEKLGQQEPGGVDTGKDAQ